MLAAYFLIKPDAGAFRAIAHFSPYSFSTAYSLGYATGQLLLPFVCLMASVILIRDSLASYVSAESAAREL